MNRTQHSRRWRGLLSGLLGSALLLSAAAGLVACQQSKAKKQTAKPEPDPLPVRVEVLKTSPFQRLSHSVATVSPWREISVRAEAPGRIKDIRKEVGDRVKKKDLLVKLDSALAYRGYKTARMGIRQAKVAVKFARTNRDRFATLRASGDIPQVQLDQAQNAYEAAKAALDMARARSAQVGQQLFNYWVRAPFAGILAKRPVNVGDYVSPGSPVFTLVEMDRVKVVVGLDPEEGLLLKKGSPATVSVQTVRGALKRAAKVHLVRPLADATTRRVEVELVVDNKDLLFKPGVVARVRIPMSAVEQRLLVPSDAVVELLGRRFVYLVREGKAVRVEVKLGVNTANRVEILPMGAAPAQLGEQLVVLGVQRLVPDAPVLVVAAPSRSK